MTGGRFEDYLRRALIPQCRPGDVLVMDNLAVHKTRPVREILQNAAIKVRYLPPYSPDLNPIELVFSKMKHLVRSAAERTVEGLQRLVRAVSRKLQPSECRKCIEHCGYKLPAT